MLGGASWSGQANELPEITSLWYVLAGFLVIMACTAGALYGFTESVFAANILTLLSLALLSFVLGSISSPVEDDHIPDEEISWEAVNLSLNHALWTMLSGASLASACVFFLLIGQSDWHCLALLLLSVAGYLVSHAVAAGLWQCRTGLQADAVPTQKIERQSPKAVDPPSYARLLQALEIAAAEATHDFSPEQPAQPQVLISPTAGTANKITVSIAAPADSLFASQLPVSNSLEYVVSDDQSIETVLELAVGTRDRLVR